MILVGVEASNKWEYINENISIFAIHAKIYGLYVIFPNIFCETTKCLRTRFMSLVTFSTWQIVQGSIFISSTSSSSESYSFPNSKSPIDYTYHLSVMNVVLLHPAHPAYAAVILVLLILYISAEMFISSCSWPSWTRSRWRISSISPGLILPARLLVTIEQMDRLSFMACDLYGFFILLLAMPVIVISSRTA